MNDWVFLLSDLLFQQDKGLKTDIHLKLNEDASGTVTTHFDPDVTHKEMAQNGKYSDHLYFFLFLFGV